MVSVPLTLTSIPPELLLQILSHLPSSTSLYALSLTSHPLSSFLHTHASSICTTLIQTHHFRASTLLNSQHISGWLMPTHPSIIRSETQWQHDLTSRSVSRASSPQHRSGLKEVSGSGCCFRSPSAGSESTVERAPRPRTSRSPQRFEPPIIASSLEARPETRHTDLSLSLTLGLPLPFKLSRPGPHYLVFLERYSAEIVARWEMYAPSEISLAESDAKRDAQFEFMLKLYCLRNWLVLCNNTFVVGEGNGVAWGDIERCSQDEESKSSRLREVVDDVRGRVRRVVGKGKLTAKRVLSGIRRKKVIQPSPTRRLLFGEIDTDSASSLNSTLGGRTLSSQDGSFRVVEKDCWVKGLLWFYGVGGQMGSADYVVSPQEESLKHVGKEMDVLPTTIEVVEFSEKMQYRRQKTQDSWRQFASRWRVGRTLRDLRISEYVAYTTSSWNQ